MSYEHYEYASELNSFWWHNKRNYKMIESVVNSLRTRPNDALVLNEGPVDEEFGRRVAQSLASNANITRIQLGDSCEVVLGVPDAIQWLTTTSTAGETPTATLAPFTNLETMIVNMSRVDISVEYWDLIFRLLLTSTSLQELHLYLKFEDGFMSALTRYLGAASRASLRNLKLSTNRLSEVDFVSLCDGVAGSQLRKLILTIIEGHFESATESLESAAESLARAIVKSPLEEVQITDSARLGQALLRTQPVRNLDFSFNVRNIAYYGRDSKRIKVNRKWKPLLSANTITVPLALWPRILEKAHASRETSHGPADILFYFLREKPDLVP